MRTPPLLGPAGFPGRLREAIGQESVNSFAKRAKLSESAVRKLLNSESSPSLKTLSALADAAGVRVSWLVEGEVAEGLNAQRTVVVSRLNGSSNTPKNDASTEASVFSLSHDWLRMRLILEPTDLRWVEVRGDSMAPDFADGDIAFIDLNGTGARIDALYAVHCDGRVQIRRLQFLAGGKIRVLSSNPAYANRTIELPTAEFEVAGRVVFCLKPC